MVKTLLTDAKFVFKEQDTYEFYETHQEFEKRKLMEQPSFTKSYTYTETPDRVKHRIFQIVFKM
jgi:hypothetical protein